MYPRKPFLLTTTLVAASFAISGCASKSYVDQKVEERFATLETQIANWSATSREALERAEKAGKLAEGKFVYNVVLTEEDVTFDSGKAALSGGSQSRLGQLASQLQADNENVYLEIQGHTDATGSEAYNHQLGQQRADAVLRYLHGQGVALDRMATISYGEEAPVADNSTASGRAQNRRVEIVVLK
ncbi:OmpA family protein [Parahaliea maris]|uniref:OmpA family protein n=1 Tax=Parahaliea maris TaxID=2716870 RepID=A0A5C9AA72_9GAMM|nr:OmpA family protein [Parahaliea maris]TXS96497.1 OmpA family protein [Parahaliea maris]